MLENVSTIDKVFAEFSRVMKSDARCIFSISHPLRALTTKTQGEDEEAWVLHNYFDHSMRQSDFGGGMVVPKYKRTLADYAEAICAAGMLIRRIVEPQPVVDAESKFPDAYAKAVRLPQLLAMELVKAT